MIGRRVGTRLRVRPIAAVSFGLFLLGSALAAQPAPPCTETVTARVVALDTTIFANRMGAQLPGAMIFALANDVQPDGAGDPNDWTTWQAGQVKLKDYKRPRPIVLRMNKGQCLTVLFRNLTADSVPTGTGQPTTRETSLHVQGLNWFSSPSDDGSWVGNNATQGSVPSPGAAVVTYKLYAPEEGPFLLYSTGDFFTFSNTPSSGSAGGDGGQPQQGLFGALHVEPETSEHYRSQVNHEDLCLASKDKTWANGQCTRPGNKLPEIDYQAVYPAGHPRAGLSILRMTQKTSYGNPELVHSDLTAVITGPYAGRFPDSLATTPGFHNIQVSPDRLQPYREFTILYHEMDRTLQAFQPLYANNQLNRLMEAANDNFAINYGMGGIGSEILANRFEVGPAAQCTDCKYEEFFLSSWPNGDPAMIVDNPSDNGCSQTGTDYTTYGCAGHVPATKSFFPDDPSNVYHGYLRDHTKFRILHGGSDLHHIHHLHAHQWLHSPNTSSGHYLDSQAIGPGAAYTLEIVHQGGGNKNLTPGDSIFHCHFYPHFASGMWSLWRVHDVFEAGTALTAYPDGEPQENSRAQPDGEIAEGTPIPALVPLPTLAMAPLPAPVRLASGGKQAEICTDDTFSDCVSALSASGDPGKFKNPGYPFFIPGMAGSRAPHPPMDFALACSVSGDPCETRGASCGGGGGVCEALDGGLPRHIVATGGTSHAPALNPLDFSKEVLSATGIGLPEDGTVIEKVAMAYHAVRNHPTATPEGGSGSFVTNGRPPAPGAPYAEPCVDANGQVPPYLEMRDYYGVDFQTTAVFNKEGWHYPQQRMIALWGDLFDFLGLSGGKPKAPEPFFIRANSNDCVRYHMANLIPKTYELDDFQVRTPTDILGQHIHLVKFDVTSSDGGGNGFNYEDGTLAPDEVTERIAAFNNGEWQPTYGAAPSTQPLAPRFIKFFGTDPTCAQGQSGASGSAQNCACESVQWNDDGTQKWGIRGGRWCGAQATVQRWYVDPTLNDAGNDLTLRTVFTHDHFGPSTHQQAGVYAALVSEPTNSQWLDNETGSPLGNRTATQNGMSLKDGGPTSWQAVIKTSDVGASFREFLLAFQDSTLMYRPFSDTVKIPSGCPAGAVCGFCSTDLTKLCVTDPTSSLYYATACPASVSLPNPTGTATALEASCNFVPGVPSKNSLFYAVASSTSANIWGINTASPSYPLLQAIGWDTLPITPAPAGLFVQGRQGTAAQPELITLNGAGANFSLNYRNEPVYPRFYGDKSGSNPQVSDPAFAYASIDRGKLPGERPSPYDDLTAGVQPGDPFTPLLRANAGDNVQVRMVVGAHQNPHNFVFNGLKWLYEPSNVNSGWRSEQTMGISEHFEYLFRVPPPLTQPGDSGTPAATTDYLYRSTAARNGQASGNWGLLRAYNQPAQNLFPVPGQTAVAAAPVCPAELMSAACGATDGKGHTLRCYSVVAAVASNLLGGKTMLYNSQTNLTGPNALLFVHEADYQKLRSGQAVPGISPAAGTAEPLVLRAAAGDCIKVTLTNKINAVGGGFASGQLPVDGQQTGNRNLFVASNTSQNVGLHPQLVSYDAGRSDGNNVGLNAVQTAAPNQSVTYWWYAGAYDPQLGHVPVELGAANLMPADPLNHHPYSLFGALIIEPEGATWTHDSNSYASATVTVGNRSFREHVLMTQDDAVIQSGSSRQTTGAVNLRTQPLGTRSCSGVSTDFSCVLSSQAQCIGANCTSQTPVYCTQKGQEARLRVLQAGGAVTGEVFELFGHTYAEEPYVTKAANCQAPVTHTNVLASQTIGVRNECPDGNLAPGPSVTEWKGARSGHGPGNHYDVVVESAGGVNQVAGDYLYRTMTTPRVSAGLWGIFRVTDGAPTAAECPSLTTPQ